MRAAVTLSLVAEAKGGPFVYWDSLANGCAQAAALGFHAVEVFAPSPAEVNVRELEELTARHKLVVAAFGTGAGWVKHKLRLTDASVAIRRKAEEFIAEFIDVGGIFNAPVIIGSMQGKWGEGTTREEAVAWLGEALDHLGSRAHSHGVPLLYEPLNRYETNLFCRAGDAAAFLNTLRTQNVKLLCDLFHMNIEEQDIATALKAVAPRLGHVHWADSNRWAAGYGHTNMQPIIEALQEIHFDGFISAEVLPLPNSRAAAEQTMRSLREGGLIK